MNILNIIIKFWQGRLPLWKSYWIVGELFNALIIIIIINIELKFFNNINILNNIPSLNFNDLHFINKFIIFIWTVFITVGVWRSAEKYKGKLIWTVITLIVLSYRILLLKELLY